MSYALKVLKPQLKTEIDLVRPLPGDILIVRPKKDSEVFTKEFCQWLADNLAEILPPAVKALILANDSTTIEKLQPSPEAFSDPEMQEAYEMGWHAAFDAIEDYHK